jgi:hypothetical protein
MAYKGILPIDAILYKIGKALTGLCPIPDPILRRGARQEAHAGVLNR